jgi:hypothetical protein
MLKTFTFLTLSIFTFLSKFGQNELLNESLLLILILFNLNLVP